MYFLFFINRSKLLKLSLVFFISDFFDVSLIGVEVKGSKDGLIKFFARFQPIELVKPFLIIL